MSKNRKIPFGYGMKNGEIIVIPSESNIVRQIFKSYISGKSLLAIANELQSKDVPYDPDDDRPWNKNMVKRILENEKYLGCDNCPAIVQRDVFQKALALKSEKTSYTCCIPKEIQAVRSLTYCAECGKRLTRTGGNIRAAYWICKNCSKYDRKLSDKILSETITDILSRAIDDPYIIEDHGKMSSYSPSSEVLCKKREIEHMIDSNADCERIKAEIFALAQLKYDCCTYRDAQTKTKDLQQILAGRERSKVSDIDLLNSCVSRIWVSHFNTIEIEFINGVKLGKEVQ